MVATDSEVRFRPANRVGRSAHRAPAAKPASSASSQPHGAGSGTVRPTITEASPPTSTCPSPPMLKTPLWKATAAPRPVMISGSIYASTFRKLLVLPKEPVSMFQYTTRGSVGKPYGQTEQHQRQNQRKQRQSNPCFFHSVPPCADDMSLPIRCGAEGQAGLQPRQRVKKSLAEFAARRRQKIKIIFSRDMCVRENTSQAASVEFVRHGRAKLCAQQTASLLSKNPEGFSTVSRGRRPGRPSAPCCALGDLCRLPHLCFFNGAGDYDGAVLDGSHRCIVLLHHISGDLIGRAVKIQVQAVLCQTLFNGTGGELTVHDILNRFLSASGEVPDGAGNVGLGSVRIQVAVKEDGQEVLLLAGI